MVTIIVINLMIILITNLITILMISLIMINDYKNWCGGLGITFDFIRFNTRLKELYSLLFVYR